MSAVAELVASVLHQMEEFKCTDHHTVQVCSPGDLWWQGDLGIEFLCKGKSSEFPKSGYKSLVEIQLAEGQNEGARHVGKSAVPGGKIAVLKVTDRGPLVGYVIYAEQGLRVDHPKHGDVTMAEPGSYVIRFQRAVMFTSTGTLTDTLARAID